MGNRFRIISKMPYSNVIEIYIVVKEIQER